MNEGAKKPDGSTEKLKLRAKNKAKERVVQKYYENTKKENDACAERNVAVDENTRSNAKVNVVSTRTTTDTKVFRGATKSNKANTVAVKSELVKPRIEIDDDEKLEAIEGNKMGVVSARLVTVIIMRS